MSTRPRLKPSQLILGIGILLAVAFGASGLSAAIEKWRDRSRVSREVFFNIPGPMVFAFYVLMPALVLWAAWQLSLRAQNWERGAPDGRTTSRRNVGRRVEGYRRGVYMQTLLRDPAAG